MLLTANHGSVAGLALTVEGAKFGERLEERTCAE